MNKPAHSALFQGPAPDVLASADTGSTSANQGMSTGSAAIGTETSPVDLTTKPTTRPQHTSKSAHDGQAGDTAAKLNVDTPAQLQLTTEDIERLGKLLTGDRLPMAARSDLVELHKRIAVMFTTLNDGLSEIHAKKAAADRAELCARIDWMEEAVNRMEGALRIEFEPVLKTALTEVMASRLTTQRSHGSQRIRALIGLGLALSVGIVLGATAGAWDLPWALEIADRLAPLYARLFPGG
ncbi:hypothetical protein [Pelagibacterium sp.]|uniref:hypothetical protein n=1 Tax=Pelagibacterium sp. TaxID=1967288 RepID=UPI003A90B3F0